MYGVWSSGDDSQTCGGKKYERSDGKGWREESVMVKNETEMEEDDQETKRC